MIENSVAQLCALYEREESKGKVPPYGYSMERVKYVFDLDKTGELVRIEENCEQVNKANIPRKALIPRPAIRSTNVMPSPLYDTAGYVLAWVDMEKKNAKQKEKAQEQQRAFVQYQHKLLQDTTEDEGIAAYLSFVCKHLRVGSEPWSSLSAKDMPKDFPDTLGASDRIAFRLEGDEGWLHERPAIQEAYCKSLKKGNGSAPCMQDLATGELGYTARLHSKIKLPGGQASGCVLSSFNCNAFTSYYLSQRDPREACAAVSLETEYAYTTMLNRLLSERDKVISLPGNTSVVIWADGTDDVEAEIVRRLLNEYTIKEEREKLTSFLAQFLSAGMLTYCGREADPGKTVFAAGFAPSSARIVERFIFAIPFHEIISNIAAHYARCAYGNVDGWLTPGRIFRRCLTKCSEEGKAVTDTDKHGSLVLPLMDAILNGAPYPATLQSAALAAIRSGTKKTAEPNALLYGILQQEKQKGDTQSNMETSIGYNCGRMFALIAYIQSEDGSKSLVNHIAYAAAFPLSAMRKPMLQSEAALNGSRARIMRRQYLGERMRDISAHIDALGGLPAVLPSSEQAAFMLGYEAEKERLYAKYEPDNESENDAEEEKA